MMGAGRANRGGSPKLPPLHVALLLSGPAAVALAAWIYLGLMIDDMSLMPGMKAMMMHLDLFSPVQFVGLFLMWTVMMAAMMLPTAATMITAYARMQARDRALGAGWGPVLGFAAGYVLAWGAFSLGATLVQAWLTNFALMSPMSMKTVSGPVTGAVLIAAGLYQVTPFKQACLSQCRSPIGFLMTEWRQGGAGALMMGLHHGLYCVGCCWALMGLLLVAGVMNPFWIIAITAYVLAEKTMPGMEKATMIVGALLIGGGLWFLI